MECINQQNDSTDVLARTLSEFSIHSAIGSDEWWNIIAAKGTPLILSDHSDYSQVLFLWRGQRSNCKDCVAVYIDINGITDHHSFDMAKLERYANTDVWYFQCRVRNRWRGSYAFMPVDKHLLQPEYQGTHQEKREQHRDWLRQLFPLSCNDPLNRFNLTDGSWGNAHSSLHMPDAIPQEEWLAFEQSADESSKIEISKGTSCITWNSRLLQNTRNVWLQCTADTTKGSPLPVVLILDGAFWAHTMPAFSAFKHATESGRIVEALYVYIDEIDGSNRWQELGCNEAFWHAVQQELFSLLAEHYTITSDARRTVVAGQSLGGLAAMYAGLNWPERFGSVLCQSGSFWWPDSSIIKPPSEYQKPKATEPLAELSRKVEQGLGQHCELHIFMEVGSGEDIMVDLSEDLIYQLAQQNHNIQFRLFDGGHDRLCWRGGLIDGLSYLLNVEN